MKKLIATALLTLAAGSASAYSADIDAQEFYEGDTGVTANAMALDANLHQEGNFVEVDNQQPQGVELGNNLDQDLHIEGNFAV